MLDFRREMILDLGFEWWVNYSCEEVGDSEASMDVASVTHAECLDLRTAGRLKALPAARAKWI